MNRRHVCAHLRYALGNRKTYLIVLLLLVPVVLFDVLKGGGSLLTAEHSLWKDFLDPITGLSTLFIAGMVWLNESRQEWRNSLPKRLTVDFVYQGRLVMRCEDADLASEGDIRALGQQIGGQMAAKDEKSKPEQFLLKAPAIRYSQARLTEDGTALCHHARFELMAVPEKLANLGAGQYLHWAPPFDSPKISRTHDG